MFYGINLNRVKRIKIILIILTLLTTKAVGQKLIYFKHTTCDEGNPHKYKMNTMINKMQFHGDSLKISITWIDNCGFEPKFDLHKVSADTLYFKYKNPSGDETTCSCAFKLQFVLMNINQKDYQIKIDKWVIKKTTKRYNTDGYFTEYYPERTANQKILREIYTENGKLIAEVFYDKNGDITSEKYYNENWGFLERERRN